MVRCTGGTEASSGRTEAHTCLMSMRASSGVDLQACMAMILERATTKYRLISTDNFCDSGAHLFVGFEKRAPGTSHSHTTPVPSAIPAVATTIISSPCAE